VYELRLDQQLFFSKKAERRFPTDEEVFELLDRLTGKVP